MTLASLASTAVRSTSESGDADLARLLGEWTDRLQMGEVVDLERVVAENPEHADRIRELWPALAVIAHAGRPSEAGPASGGKLDTSRLGDAQSLGEFRLLRELGRGGMGVVYEAEQLTLGRKVALKVLPFAGLLDNRQLARFQNEARAAATLNHPNIVPVYAVGEDRGVHFYAMQLIRGASLADVVGAVSRSALPKRTSGTDAARSETDHGQRTPDQSEICNQKSEIETQPLAALSTEYSTNPKRYFGRVAEIGICIAEALDHAHQCGILHRDVKPANILLDAAGKPWITDFGLARIGTDPSMTVTGDLVGTLRYMSPEQVSGAQVTVDHRTDVYSLGVTLYELVTGTPAFTGQDRGDLLRRISEEDPRSPRQFRPELPVDLETIIHKATEKNPGDRYASCAELAADLQRYLVNEPLSARRPNLVDRVRKWSRRHREVVAAAAAMFLLTTLLTAVIAVRIAYEQGQTAEALGESERQRLRAEQNLITARKVVDDMYVQVAERWLEDEPQMQPVQRQFLEKAARFYEDVAAQQDGEPSLQAELAEAYRRMGEVRFRLGDYSNAEPALLEAVRRFEETLGLTPLDVDLHAGLARSLHSLGRLVSQTRYVSPGNPAIKSFGRAAAIGRRIAHMAPDVPDHQKQFIASSIDYGRSLSFLLTDSDAEKVLHEALSAAKHGRQQFPDIPTFGYLQASALHALAEFSRAMKGDPELAAEYARNAISVCEEMLKTDPRSAAARNLLADSHRWLASSLPSGPAKRAAISRAVAIRSDLFASYPDVPLYQKELGVDFGLSAEEARRAGNFESELAHRETSVRYLADAWAATPTPGYRDVYSGVFLCEGLTWLAEGLDTLDRASEAANVRARQKLVVKDVVETSDPAPDTASDFVSRALLRLRLNDVEGCLADHERARQLDPQTADLPASTIGHAYASRAAAFYGLGEHEEALASIQRAIELNPTNSTWHYNWGQSLVALKRYDDAIESYSTSISLNAHDPDAYSRRAAALCALERYDEARADATKSIELAPGNPGGYAVRADVSCAVGRHEDALHDISKCIELSPGSAELYNGRAVEYDHLGRHAEGLADSDQAIALSPHNAMYHRGRAAHLYNLSRFEESLQTLNRAIELDAENAPAYYMRGIVFARLGRHEASLADLQKSREMGCVAAFKGLAELLADYRDASLRDPQEAIKMGERAVELSPQDGEAWTWLGVANYRTGDYGNALAALERSLGPEETRGGGTEFFFLAMTCFRLNQTENAQEWFNRAVEWLHENPKNHALEQIERYRHEAEQLLGTARNGEPPVPSS